MYSSGFAALTGTLFEPAILVDFTAELIKERIQKTSERLSDSLYLKQITDYALLKYKRRFLLGHKMDQEEERKEK